jgi:type IV pilus assembly protein PilA
MKNKGFTLTELLAVLVVIGILLGIAIPTYQKIRLSVLKKDYENVTSTIEVAAQKYASENNFTGEDFVNVQLLIDSGYLPPDDSSGNIYNPMDNSKILNCYIYKITMENGEYIINLYKESDGTNTCSSYVSGDDANITCNPGCNTWQTQDVTLTSANVEDGNTYHWTSTNGYNGTGSSITIKCNNDNIETGEYTLSLTKADGTNTKGKVSVKIDKQPPKIINESFDNNVATDEVESRTITVIGTDNQGSGLKGYYFFTTAGDSTCPTDSSSYTNVNTFTYDTESDTSQTYTYCLMDNVGLTTKKTVSVGPITVLNLVAPTITSSDGITSDNWHPDVFSLNLTGGTYYQISYDNSTWTKIDGKSIAISLDQNNKTIYIRTCNKSESKISDTNSNYIIKIDNTPPTITFGVQSSTVALIRCEDSESGVKESTITESLTGSSDITVTKTCENNAGLKTTDSHVYKYQTGCWSYPSTCTLTTYDNCATTTQSCTQAACTKKCDTCNHNKTTCGYTCDAWTTTTTKTPVCHCPGSANSTTCCYMDTTTTKSCSHSTYGCTTSVDYTYPCNCKDVCPDKVCTDVCQGGQVTTSYACTESGCSGGFSL